MAGVCSRCGEAPPPEREPSIYCFHCGEIGVKIHTEDHPVQRPAPKRERMPWERFRKDGDDQSSSSDASGGDDDDDDDDDADAPADGTVGNGEDGGDGSAGATATETSPAVDGDGEGDAAAAGSSAGAGAGADADVGGGGDAADAAPAEAEAAADEGGEDAAAATASTREAEKESLATTSEPFDQQESEPEKAAAESTTPTTPAPDAAGEAASAAEPAATADAAADADADADADAGTDADTDPAVSEADAAAAASEESSDAAKDSSPAPSSSSSSSSLASATSLSSRRATKSSVKGQRRGGDGSKSPSASRSRRSEGGGDAGTAGGSGSGSGSGSGKRPPATPTESKPRRKREGKQESGVETGSVKVDLDVLSQNMETKARAARNRDTRHKARIMSRLKEQKAVRTLRNRRQGSAPVAKSCAKCGRDFSPKDERVLVKGEDWHRNCWVRGSRVALEGDLEKLGSKDGNVAGRASLIQEEADDDGSGGRGGSVRARRARKSSTRAAGAGAGAAAGGGESPKSPSGSSSSSSSSGRGTRSSRGTSKQQQHPQHKGVDDVVWSHGSLANATDEDPALAAMRAAAAALAAGKDPQQAVELDATGEPVAALARSTSPSGGGSSKKRGSTKPPPATRSLSASANLVLDRGDGDDTPGGRKSPEVGSSSSASSRKAHADDGAGSAKGSKHRKGTSSGRSSRTASPATSLHGDDARPHLSKRKLKDDDGGSSQVKSAPTLPETSPRSGGSFVSRRMRSFRKKKLHPLSGVSARKATFDKAWPMDEPSPAAMAGAGFLFDPTERNHDRVMCFACGTVLVDWEPTDDPRERHREEQPMCTEVLGWTNSDAQSASVEAAQAKAKRADDPEAAREAAIAAAAAQGAAAAAALQGGGGSGGAGGGAGGAGANDGSIFGASLAEVLDAEDSDDMIPAIVKATAGYLRQKNRLKTDGVFRLSPSHTEMMHALGAIDRLTPEERADPAMLTDPRVNTMDEENTIHLAAGLLKRFLRDLATPVLTFELYICFIAVWDVPTEDAEMKLGKFKTICDMLPDMHVPILRFLLDFIADIAEHEEDNRMTINNLAVVFAPGILRSDEDFAETLSEQTVVVDIVAYFIQHRAHLLGEQ